MYLTSANSINWGRLLPQIVYYFSAYADLAASGEIQVGDKLNVAVPTGNFGNILACYYAKRMGLPIGRLICASNRNDVLTEFLTTGTYNRKREFHLTNTPSMDILISSNLERYLFELFGREARAVAYCMYRLNEGGSTRSLPRLWIRSGRNLPHTAVTIRRPWTPSGRSMTGAAM